MSRITITILTDTNAFFEDRESSETARILQDIAYRLNTAIWRIQKLECEPLFDVNGNKVGTITVSEKRS